MKFLQDTMISAASAAVNQTSGAVNTSFAIYASVQGVVTGTSTGTLKLQVSNDAASPVNWSDLPSATVAIAGAGSYLIPQVTMAYMFVRAVYAATNAQAGTITVNLKTSNG